MTVGARISLSLWQWISFISVTDAREMQRFSGDLSLCLLLCQLVQPRGNSQLLSTSPPGGSEGSKRKNKSQEAWPVQP